jgi:hypothetical protein
MKRLPILCILLAVLAGCRSGLWKNTKGGVPGNITTTVIIEDNGIRFSLASIKNCRYPVNDPLFEKKKNKKLVLLQLQLQCVQTGKKISVLPAGAMLTDSRGNEYVSSPAVIAMAQTSRCINDDDIGAYNAIWNGDIHSGEPYTAWVLGFEMPDDAIPGRLYWNHSWRNKQLFFDFNGMNDAINQ